MDCLPAKRLLLLALAVATPVMTASAGEILFQRSFNGTSSPQFDSPSPGAVVSIDPTGGPDGSGALRTVGNGSGFEGFWNVAGGTAVSDAVFRLSYDHRVATQGFAGSRLYMMGTYSDALKRRDGVAGQYRAMYAIGNTVNHPDDVPAFFGTPDQQPPLIQSRGDVHYDSGKVVDNVNRVFIDDNLTFDTYRHVVQYISLRQLLADGADRVLSRLLTIDRSSVLGSVHHNEVLPPTGIPFVEYDRYEMRAIQLFNSNGNSQTGRVNFTGFGVTNWFDNLKFERLNSSDIDSVFADFGSTDLTRDYNNDGAVNAADSDVFVNRVLGTRLGDTNLDYAVDFADLLALAQNFGTSGSWGSGDFDGDGSVGFADLLALAQNFGFGTTSSLSLDHSLSQVGLRDAYALVVPEPGIVSLVLVGGIACLRRRERVS